MTQEQFDKEDAELKLEYQVAKEKGDWVLAAKVLKRIGDFYDYWFHGEESTDVQ